MEDLMIAHCWPITLGVLICVPEGGSSRWILFNILLLMMFSDFISNEVTPLLILHNFLFHLLDFSHSCSMHKASLPVAMVIYRTVWKDYCRNDHFSSFLENIGIAFWWSIYNFYYVTIYCVWTNNLLRKHSYNIMGT
jgi:hypothetical protein